MASSVADDRTVLEVPESITEVFQAVGKVIEVDVVVWIFEDQPMYFLVALKSNKFQKK